ncbi:MAG: DUF2207 domain-containing protein [Candidatus Komeilibacteria bacterium]|nr:DUF2207 domain-containing protein [Candidatus Komeilibacteria bacterium]
MRYHHKRFLTLFIVLLILSLLAIVYFIVQYQQPKDIFSFITKAKAAATTEEYIDDFQAKVKINPDNSVDVLETITYNFGDLKRHGIVREIPYSYLARGGNFSVGFKVLGVTDAQDQPINYTVERSGGSAQIKIGDPDVLISGRQVYKIQYNLNRVINFLSDRDEFYWNVTGNNWPVAIDRAGIVIVLPQEVPAATLQAGCFTGQLGSAEQNCRVTNITNSQIGYSSFNTLPAGEGLTVVLGWPKGVLTPPTFLTQAGWVLRDNPLVLLPLLVLLIMFLLWYLHGRDLGKKQAIIPLYEAPEKLSPVEVGSLIDERVNLSDISATFIDLAIKGYLKIKKVSGEQDWELFKLKDFSGLLPWENEFAADVFGSKESIKISQLKNHFYLSLPKLKRAVYNLLVEKKFFPTSPAKTRGLYLIISLILFVLGLVVLPFYSGALNIFALIFSATAVLLIGRIMPYKTVLGHKVCEEIKGYQMYLSVAESAWLKFHNAPEKTPEVFEKNLPYAMALKVEKQWAKQFEAVYLHQPGWFEGNFTAFNAVIFINSLNNFSSSSRSAFMTAPSSGAAGGHSGFSGGFSGGGFGGGGGGSW